MRNATDKLSSIAAEMGRRGGKARAAKMTKAERSAAARKAALARWKKTDEKPKT